MSNDAAATSTVALDHGQPRDAWHLPRREVLAALCALMGEALVVYLGLKTAVSPGTILSIHVAIAAWTWLILFAGRPADEDATIAGVLLLFVLAAGPAGALAAVFIVALSGRRGESANILSAWYKRLADAGGVEPATATHDRVVAGRVLQLDAPPPLNFADVIAYGTLEERQTALGLIARRFHPDFAPALEAALRSPEPVVRVQAAAVVARVRGDLKTKIAGHMAKQAKLTTAPVATRLAHAATLQGLAACSLVEATDKIRCRAAADQLFKDALIETGGVAAAAAAAGLETAPAIEAYLMENRRYKDFRVARRVRSIAARPNFKVRRARMAAVVA
jgi:hypothetical protein